MATRRKKPPKPVRPPSDLRPYGEVIDTAAVNSWTAELWRDRNRKWTLDIRDRGELIARGASYKKTPECFVHLGKMVKLGLEKSKRLKG